MNALSNASVAPPILVVVSVVLVAERITARLGPRRPVPTTPSPERLDRRGMHLLGIRHRRRPTTVTAAALAEWSDEIARSLRHGSTLRSALVEVMPAGAGLTARTGSLRHRLERGATVTEACDGWSDDLVAERTRRHDDNDLVALLATLLAACATLGGAAAAPLDRFAVTMRQRTSDDLERDAQSAQARLSARVLTFVPLVVLGLLLATDDDVRSIVIEPAGAFAVGLGLSLNALGAWWMRRIVDVTPATVSA